MKTFALLVAALAGCAEPLAREERQLADISELTAVVDTDVGVPQDPFGTPNIATGLTVLIDYANTDTCYSLHASATARVDGQEPDVFFTGGLESSDSDSYCTKPAIYVDAQPAPRDVSTITVSDDSAVYSISVARLFVNPKITVAPTLAVGPQVVRIDDPRAIASAIAWWRSSDGAQAWMKTVDTSVKGELRFAIPSGTSGSGTLGISLTIRDNDVTCIGFQSCKAIVRGGGAFAVTVQ